MRKVLVLLVCLVVFVGCSKKDDGISVEKIKQCRDEATGQFVPCPE